jgi:hypothetical protein
MAAWDDVIDFDNFGEWPMELSGWLKLLQSLADEEQRSQIVQLVRNTGAGVTQIASGLLPAGAVRMSSRSGLVPNRRTVPL